MKDSQIVANNSLLLEVVQDKHLVTMDSKQEIM